MNTIVLKGCRSQPLSAYLKSLAVLRILAKQADPSVMCWWQGRILHIASELGTEALEEFFVSRYKPTPIVSPWNGGSGFDEDDDEVFASIAKSSDGRLAAYRETIGRVQQLNLSKRSSELEAVMDELGAEPDKRTVANILRLVRPLSTNRKAGVRKTIKKELIPLCRDNLPDEAVDWIDAAIAVNSAGDLAYPPLLGTGGNDGHLDFSGVFMKCISSLILARSKEQSLELLRNALYGTSTSSLMSIKVGQFDPGHAGGSNQGSGRKGVAIDDQAANPWDFILLMEGSIMWASGVTRRMRASSRHQGRLASPFTVRSISVGDSSVSGKDKTAGDNSRGEIWAPLWRQPTGFGELQMFLAEGRADIGNRPATNTIEFAEAATSLGVDRGVNEFIRYDLLTRRGKSYLALPLGHFSVQKRDESDLVRELEDILRRLYMPGSGSEPAGLHAAKLLLHRAAFDLLRNGGPGKVKELVAAMGHLQAVLPSTERAGRPSRPFGGLRGLSPRWLQAADDGSVEVRLAVALSSIGGRGGVGSLRSNLEAVDPTHESAWATGHGQVAWQGNSLSARLLSVLQRRVLDAQRLNITGGVLRGRVALHPRDVAAFIEGRVDEGLLEDLIFGFSSVDWTPPQTQDICGELRGRWAVPVRSTLVPRSWAILKLLFLGELLRAGPNSVQIEPDPSVLELLRADRVGDACISAARRLYSSGLNPASTDFSDRAGEGVRVGAALLFPVRQNELLRLQPLRPRRSVQV